MADTAPKGESKRKNRGNRRGRSNGYVHKSPAVCVVVHDPSGRTMPESDATEIVNTIHEIAFRKGYLINFTRT